MTVLPLSDTCRGLSRTEGFDLCFTRPARITRLLGGVGRPGKGSFDLAGLAGEVQASFGIACISAL